MLDSDPPLISNILAPPAILAVMRLREAPLASIIFNVSRIPVSAYFIVFLRPGSMFSGSMMWINAPSLIFWSYKQIPIQDPSA